MPIFPNWLTRLAKKEHIELLHSHFGNMGWFGLKAARRLNIPHIVTFYGLDVDHLPKQDAKWLNRYAQLFDSADAILCVGSHMADRIIRRGCAASKVRVHRLGVDLKSIPFHPRTKSGGEALKVLIASSFREKKGIPYALEALGELKKIVNLEITVIGDADTDPRSKDEKRKILNVIAKYGLERNIRLLGYRTHTEMFEEAYKHHIFLSPSIHAADGDAEGAPVSIVEMAASGMPVVSTFHCDIPEIIEHGVSGLLAPERDVDALFKHLNWLAKNPEQWLRLSSAARKHIETNYNMPVQAEKLASIYREIKAKYD